jgi:hypothetical protein
MRTANLMVILYVHDMRRAIAFDRVALGLVPLSESPGWSMLSCGGALAGRHIIELDTPEVRQAGGPLRAIREAEPPRAPVRLAEVLDCEGNAIELCQYVNFGHSGKAFRRLPAPCIHKENLL